MFKEAKARLESLFVPFILTGDEVKLYLFEMYCAMESDTSEWISFRSH